MLVNRRNTDVSFGNRLSVNSSILVATHHSLLQCWRESPITELWGMVLVKFQEANNIWLSTLLASHLVLGFKTITELSLQWGFRRVKVKADAPFIILTQKDGGSPGWLPMWRKNIPVRGSAGVKEQPWSNAVGSPTRANLGTFRLAHSNT